MESIFPGLTHAPNLHPLVVHFPIVFWVTAAIAWAFATFHENERVWQFGRWLHVSGASAAVIATAVGFWVTDRMGHDSPGHDLIHVHRDLMLVATTLSILIAALGWWRRGPDKKWRIGLTTASLILVSVMTLGADRGAELVFRYGIGVAGDPPPHTQGHDHDHGHEHEPSSSSPGGHDHGSHHH